MTYQRRAGSVLVSLDDDTHATDARVVMRDVKRAVDPDHRDSALLFTRDQWASFVYDVAHELPVDSTTVQLRKVDEAKPRWHVRDPKTGATLYFDKDEWEAFRRAAVDGALDLSPTVGRPPQASSTGGGYLVAGGCLVIAGIAAWLVFGHDGWALVGLAATAVVLGARVYYRLIRALLPYVLPGGHAPTGSPYRTALRVLAPTGVFVPTVAGIVLTAGTHEWRWVVTGLVISAVLPAVGMLPIPGAATDILPSAEFVFGAGLLLLGVPAVVLAWLWTDVPSVLLYGGMISVCGTMLSLLTATLLVSRDG
jgi:hypothetical protein